MGYFPNAAFLRRTEAEVALLRLLQLQGRAFDPGVVNVMVTAFDNTLRELNLWIGRTRINRATIGGGRP